MDKIVNEYLNNLIKKQENNNNKVIFHVDVNNAFLSWTAVELLKDGYHDIRDIPSIIGGDETKRSGIVLAKSNPAKALGIKTAEPIYFALKKVPNLEIFPPNHLLYKEKSDELNNIFSKYTQIIEKYSIDESFLDVSDYLLGKTPLELAKILQKDIYDSLGFTVNIGISNSKILAKTASDFKKPNMIHILYTSEIKEKLWNLDISSLFSVGKKMQEGLRKLQLNTIGDIAVFDPNFLEKKFGKQGIEIWKLANGIDNSIVEHNISAPKSISNSTTLVSNTKDKELIKNVILELVENVSTRLREENLKCKTIRLTLRNKDFKDKSKQISLTNYTNNTKEIYNTSLILLDKIYSKTEIRLIGISLDHLIDGNIEQLNLFSNLDSNIMNDNKNNNTINNKDNKKEHNKYLNEKPLDYILDDINKKYKKNVIKRARNITKKDK